MVPDGTPQVDQQSLQDRECVALQRHQNSKAIESTLLFRVYRD